MPRRKRQDRVGGLFHVMNRGLARRTVFEETADYRYFFSRMARSGRRGEIEILAFSPLTTHYHLLVRSRGYLSEALRRIQNEYVRYFNRSRKRDGPLFRGRFLSVPIRNFGHLRNSYLYIDDNPVSAKLADVPEAWLWGSAAQFARGRPGRWLSADIKDRLGVSYDPGRAPEPQEVRVARAGLIEARLLAPASDDDPLETFLSGTPENVRAWMVRKARLADGTKPGVPCAGAQHVRAIIAAQPVCGDGGMLKLDGTKCHPVELLLAVGLLRDLASLTFTAIGRHVRRSPANAKRLHEIHSRAVLDEPSYAELVLEIIDLIVAPFRAPGSAAEKP